MREQKKPKEGTNLPTIKWGLSKECQHVFPKFTYAYYICELCGEMF